MDKWNRIESIKINPHTYGQLIFDKRDKNIQWEKTISSAIGAGEGRTAACKSMKLKHTLSPYTKINSK